MFFFILAVATGVGLDESAWRDNFNNEMVDNLGNPIIFT